MKKSNNVNEVKNPWENVDLDKIPDLVERKKEEKRRFDLEFENELKNLEIQEKERKERSEEIQKVVFSDKLKKLFPDLNSGEIISRIIIELNLQNEIKELLKESEKGEKKKRFNPDSSLVFHFKLFKSCFGGGDRSILNSHLVRYGFESIENFSSPYPNSVKVRKGEFDEVLSEDDREVLKEFDLLGNIEGKKLSPKVWEDQSRVIINK